MRCQHSTVAHRIISKKMVHGPKKIENHWFMTTFNLSWAKHAPQINQKKQLDNEQYDSHKSLHCQCLHQNFISTPTQCNFIRLSSNSSTKPSKSIFQFVPFQLKLWKYSIAALTFTITGHGLFEKRFHYFHFWKNYLAWSAGDWKSYSSYGSNNWTSINNQTHLYKEL